MSGLLQASALTVVRGRRSVLSGVSLELGNGNVGDDLLLELLAGGWHIEHVRR